MTVQVAVRPAAAISELAFCLGYEQAGEIPLYVDGKPNASHYLPCADITRTGQRLARLAHTLDLEQSAEVAIGLPRKAEFVYSCTALHAWVSGTEQVKLASKFSPKPSIVLKVGSSSERLLLWILKNPVSETKAALLNSRLSYALRAPRTRSKPEALRVPLPGSFARVGRGRPAPILLTRLHVISGQDAEKVAGRLKDPPANDAWRDRVTR